MLGVLVKDESWMSQVCSTWHSLVVPQPSLISFFPFWSLCLRDYCSALCSSFRAQTLWCAYPLQWILAGEDQTALHSQAVKAAANKGVVQYVHHLSGFIVRVVQRFKARRLGHLCGKKWNSKFEWKKEKEEIPSWIRVIHIKTHYASCRVKSCHFFFFLMRRSVKLTALRTISRDIYVRWFHRAASRATIVLYFSIIEVNGQKNLMRNRVNLLCRWRLRE